MHRRELARGAREEVGVAHPPRDHCELHAPRVVALEILEHLVLGPVLRDVVPRRRVDLRRDRDHVQLERLRPRDDAFVLRDVDGVVREAARLGEVEVVLEPCRRVGAQARVDTARVEAVLHRHRPARNLQKEVELLRRRGRVREDDLAAVDRMDDELFGNIFVETLVVLVAVTVAEAEEVLADEDGRGLGELGRLDFLVEGDHWPGRADREARVFIVELVLRRLGRDVHERHREHHFGETRRRPREVLREEPVRPAARREIVPERVHADQPRVLPLDG